MKLSASQAAKRTGKSVPTITRAIKSGKLSAEKIPSGGYKIDASELFRVFKAVANNTNVKGNALPDETPLLGVITNQETKLLSEKLEALEAALADAKSERDEWREQAKRLALALPPPDASSPPKKRRWWFRT